MKRAIIHIGMHKTGTSSIQQTFQNYDDGKMRYVRLGVPNHSELIYAVFGDPPAGPGVYRQRGYRRDLFERRDEIAAKLNDELAMDRETFLLSGEGIIHLGAAGLARLLPYFEERGIGVQFFAYLREPVSFMSSGFQQQVKGGNATMDFGGPDYRRRFKHFVDLAGRDAMTFAPFLRETLLEGSVVRDYAHRMGIDAAQVTEQAANESLSDSVVALIFFWNREDPQIPDSREEAQARRATIRFVSRHFPGRFRLDPAACAGSIDVEDTRWMEEVSGLSLMPGAVPEGEAGIASEDDLNALRNAAKAQLFKVVARKGIDMPASGTTSRAMTRLYRSFLRTARH